MARLTRWIAAALLLAPSVAMADPISVTLFFMEAGFGATFAAFAGTVASFVSLSGIVGTALVVNGVLSAKRARSAARRAYEASLRDRKLVIRSSESPRTITYGRDRVGGTLVYACTSGSYSEYLHLVITLAGHEIDAVEEVYLGEDALGALDANGWATTGKFVKTRTKQGQQYIGAGGGSITLPAGATNISCYGVGGDQIVEVAYTLAGSTLTTTRDATVTYTYPVTDAYVRVKKFLGVSSGERDTDLETASSGQWTANHLGRGVARIHVTLRYDLDVFASGLPQISAVIRGKKLYDPRTSTTGWSQNAALAVRDYLTDALGFGEPAASINASLANAAANVCDELVPISILYLQPRYTANGTISTEDDRLENLATLLSAMVGTASRSGGEWLIRAGAYVAPTLDLDEDDLADGNIEVGPALPKRELFNAVRGLFVDPAQNHAVVDFPPYASSVYAADDGGEVLYRDIRLPMTNDVRAAQRIAKLILHRARQALVCSATFKLSAYRLQPGDTFRMTSSFFGWSNKVFRVVDRRLVQPGTIQLAFQEEASAVYDWAYTEAANYDPAPNTNLPDPGTVQAISGLAVAAIIKRRSDGVAQIGLKATWDGSTDIGVRRGGSIVVEAMNAVTGVTITTITSGDSTETVVAEAVGDGDVYRVRAQASNGLASSDWAYAPPFTVAGPTDAPNPPTSFSATAEAFGVRLRWVKSTSYDVVEYQVRVGASWDTGEPVGAVSADTLYWQPQTAGTRSFWIKSVDAWGNVSTAVQADVTTTVPPVAGLAVSVDGDSALIVWSPPAASYAIADYEIRVGADYGTSNLLGYSKTTFDRRRITGVGTIRYWVAARDINGNLGTATSVDLVVSAPATPVIASEVVDNFVLLRWQDCRTTLPVERYEVYRDAAMVGDNGDGRFAVLFEQSAGDYSYSVKAHDSAGNASAAGAITVRVSAPPDYVLRDSFDSTLAGTLTNGYLIDGRLLMPLYVETDAAHTTRIGYSTDSAAAAAGLTKWWMSGHTTSSYVETFDLTLLTDPSTITVTLTSEVVGGAPSVAYEIKVSATGAFAGEETTLTGPQAYAGVQFRYVRVTLTVTGAGGDDLLAISAMNVKVATKLKTETGIVNVSANPTTVTPTGTIQKILGIALTPAGSAGRIAVYDYTSGTTFKAYLFDHAGVAVTGDVAWTIRGV